LPDEPNPSLDELKKVLPGAAPIDTNQSIQYKQKKSTNNN